MADDPVTVEADVVLAGEAEARETAAVSENFNTERPLQSTTISADAHCGSGDLEEHQQEQAKRRGTISSSSNQTLLLDDSTSSRRRPLGGNPLGDGPGLRKRWQSSSVDVVDGGSHDGPSPSSLPAFSDADKSGSGSRRGDHSLRSLQGASWTRERRKSSMHTLFPQSVARNFLMRSGSGISKRDTEANSSKLNGTKQADRPFSNENQNMAMRVDRYLFSPFKTLADQFRKLQAAPFFSDAYCPYITTPEEVKIEEEKAQRVGSKVRRKAVVGAQLFAGGGADSGEKDEGVSRAASNSARAEKAQEVFRRQGSVKSLAFASSGEVFVNRGGNERDHMSAAVTSLLMKIDNQRMVEEADADNVDIDDPTMETHIFLQHLMTFALIGSEIFLIVADGVLLLARVAYTGDMLCMDEPSRPTDPRITQGIRVPGLASSAVILGLQFVLCIYTFVSTPTLMYGSKQFAWDIAHFCVLIASLGLLIANLYYCMAATSVFWNWNYYAVTRGMLFIATVRFSLEVREGIHARHRVLARVKFAVSQNKRRFRDQRAALDLDLTYVCDRLIAMAIPTVIGAHYRNHIGEVSRFFASRHYGRFMIFNLCEHFEENGNANYNPDLLYGQLEKLPFRDHNAPPIHFIVNLCRKAVKFLNLHPENVVTVHCRGGKGRTGTMIASLLMWTGVYDTWVDAATYFSKRRTDMALGEYPYQGITSPSQLRYVSYVSRMLNPAFDDENALAPPSVLLTKIVMRTTPFNNMKHPYKQYYMGLVIEVGNRVVFDILTKGCLQLMRPHQKGLHDVHTFDCGAVVVSGDVTIRMYRFKKDKIDSYLDAADCQHIELNENPKRCMIGPCEGLQLCFVTFHTAFEGKIVTFKRCDADGPHHDPRFTDNFSIEVLLTSLQEAALGASLDLRAGESFDSRLRAGESFDGRVPSTDTEPPPARKSKDSRNSSNAESNNNNNNNNKNDLANFLHTMSSFESQQAVSAMNFLQNGTQTPPQSSTPINNRKRGRGRVISYRPDAPGLNYAVTTCGTRDAILRECLEVREFQPGELMFDDATVTSRAGKAVIFYIESGTAEYTYDENSKRHSNLCMPRGMNFIGQGDFYGVSHHLLVGQNNAFWAGRKLTAFTKSKVRVVRLSPLEDGFTISDLHVDGFTDAEDAGMWKIIAMGEHRFATDAQSFLDLIHQQVDTMDHDLTADVDLRSTLKQFVRDLGISVRERIYFSCPVDLGVSGGTVLSGRIFILRTCIIFKCSWRSRVMKSQAQYVVSRFKEVKRVQPAGEDSAVFDIFVSRRPPSRKSSTYSVPDLSSSGSSNAGDERGSKAQSFANAGNKEDSCSGVKRVDSLSEPIMTGRGTKVMNMVDLAETSLQSEHSIHTLKKMAKGTLNSAASESSQKDGGDLTCMTIKCPTRDAAFDLHEQVRQRIETVQRGAGADLQSERSDEVMFGYISFGYLLSGEEELDESSDAIQFLMSLWKLTKSVTYNEGDEIIQRGQRMDELLHVISGRVVARDRRGGNIEILPGEIFAEQSFLDDNQSLAPMSFVAAETTECLVMSKNDVKVIFERLYPRMGARFYRTLALYSTMRSASRWRVASHIHRKIPKDANSPESADAEKRGSISTSIRTLLPPIFSGEFRSHSNPDRLVSNASPWTSVRSPTSDANGDASGRDSDMSDEELTPLIDLKRQLSNIPGSPAYSRTTSSVERSPDASRRSRDRRASDLSDASSTAGPMSSFLTSPDASRRRQSSTTVQDGVDDTARAARPLAETAILPFWAETAILPEHPGEQDQSTGIQGGNGTKPEAGPGDSGEHRVNTDAIVAQPPKASFSQARSSPRVDSPSIRERGRGMGTPANIPVTSRVRRHSISTSPDTNGRSPLGSGSRSRLQSEDCPGQDGSGPSLSRLGIDSQSNEGSSPENGQDVEIGVRDVRHPGEGGDETGAIIGKRNYPGGSC